VAGQGKRHEPPRIVGDLLRAEIAEKHAQSMEFAERFSQGSGGLPDR
jgi:hypothetical protein